MIWFFAISIFCTGLIYSGLLVYCLHGWKKLDDLVLEPATTFPQAKFSIIIPARNEAQNIVKCISDILKQDCPSQMFEIIVVDDHSEDETVALVNSLKTQNPEFNIHITELGKMLLPDNSNSYKKIAIERGIKQSQFDWIITTDADCARREKWLSSIANFIAQNPDCKLVSAPVMFTYDDNFFQKSQALEFAGLIGIGAASIANGTPNMCNGANLIYQKQAFFEVGGYAGFNDIASGDDEFLMHKIAAKFSGSVKFLKQFDAIVSTPALTNLNDFIQQRKRWSSKSRKYQNPKLTALLLMVYLFYLFCFISFIAGFFNPYYFIVLVFGLLLKGIPEFIFLEKITAFFKQEKLMNYYLPSIPLQLLYVLFIGIYGNFGKYNWKGRKVK